MKHVKLWLSLVLLTLVGNTFADELKVTNFALEPGETKEVAVELANPDSPYILIEMWMTLPQGVTIALDEDGEYMVELNSARVAKTHSLEIREHDTGKFKMLLWSSRNAELKGTSGTLFTMTLTASQSLAKGTYQGKFLEQMFVKPDQSPYYPGDASFTIQVGDDQQGGDDPDDPIVEPQTDNRLFAQDAEARTGSQVVLNIELNNDQEVAGFTCDLSLPQGVTVATDDDDEPLAVLNPERARQFLLLSNRLNNGDYRFATLPKSFQKIQGTQGVVLSITLDVDESLADGDYTVGLTHNNLTVTKDGALVTLPIDDTTSKLSVTSIALGDVNGDGIIDLTDGIAISYHYLQQTPDGFIEKVADVNGDGVIDLTDAITVVYMYLTDSNN